MAVVIFSQTICGVGFLSPVNVLQTAAWASDAPSCSLPVCDIPAAIQTLTTDTQDQRYKMVSGIRLANKKTVDPLVLQNLKDFAQAAKALFVSVQEADWLIREADTLYTFSLDGLAKYSRPILASTITPLYMSLDTEELRFDVLLYWTAQIQTSNSPADIKELMKFANQAMTLSLANHDSDYVIRQAQAVLTNGTDRYSQLHPYYEGLYSIQLQCSDASSAGGCPTDVVQEFHRLVILDTQDPAYGVRIMIAADASASASIGFDHSVFDAATSSLTSSSNIDQEIGSTRDIMVSIDPVTGQVKGTFEDTRYPGNFTFTGTVIRNVGQELNALPPSELALEQLVGSYQGAIGSIQGTLVVKILAHQRLAATFVSNDSYSIGGAQVPVITLDFQVGRWLPAQGLLMLAGSVPQTRSAVKLVLAYRRNNGTGIHSGNHLEGFEFSQYAREGSARFTRLPER